MTTINLQQEGQRAELVGSAGKASTSLIFFAVIAVTFSVVWGGLTLASSSIEKKNNALKTQIEATSTSLNERKLVDEVFDLQARLGLIKSNLATKPDLRGVLDKIAKVVIPGIVFSTYSTKDKEVIITMKGSNFDLISKQIFNFKRADFSAGAEVVNIERDDKGVKCQVALHLK
jgi:hypothetical protein